MLMGGASLPGRTVDKKRRPELDGKGGSQCRLPAGSAESISLFRGGLNMGRWRNSDQPQTALGARVPVPAGLG